MHLHVIGVIWISLEGYGDVIFVGLLVESVCHATVLRKYGLSAAAYYMLNYFPMLPPEPILLTASLLCVVQDGIFADIFVLTYSLQSTV